MQAIILNHNAGSAWKLKTRKLESAAKKKGIPIFQTSVHQDASTLAKRLIKEGYDTLFAAGGDGTFHQVLNATAPDFQVQLGVIPLGTCNDFAQSNGLDIKKAIDALGSSKTKDVDVLKTGDIYGAVAVAGGLIGKLAGDSIDPRLKKSLGPLAYAQQAARSIPRLQTYDMIIEADGETIAVSATNIAAIVSRHAGCGLYKGEIPSGRLRLVAVRTPPLSKLPEFVQLLWSRDIENSELVLNRCIRKAKISSEPEMEYMIDGEKLSTGAVDAEAVPQKIKLVVV